MKNVIGYVRVSTGDQDYKRQIDDIAEYCRIHNLKVIETFTDKDSGKNDERTGLLQMMNYIKSNPVDIVISELSRFGRTSDVLNKIKELDKLGICLHSKKENIRTLNEKGEKDLMGSLLITILSGVNSLELDTMKYRFKSGAEHNILAGGVIGGSNVPYGYKNVDSKLVINQAEALVIKEIFKQYLDGKGTNSITDWLNKENVPTRWNILLENRKSEVQKSKKVLSNRTVTNRWFDSSVVRILKNSIYCGKRIYKGKELPLNQDFQIIDIDTYNNVLNRITDQSRKTKYMTYNYMLNMRIECGNCGKPFFAYQKKSDREHARYICLSTKYKTECNNTSFNISRLEDLVIKVIYHRLKDELLNNIDVNDINERIEVIRIDLEHLNIDIDDTTKQQNKLIQQNIKGITSDDLFAANMKPLNAQLKSFQTSVRLKEEQLLSLKNDYTNMKDIKKIRLDYIKEGKAISASVVNTIVSKIVITKLTENIPSVFKNKQDRVVEIKIISAGKEHKYLMSQRTDIIYDVNGPDGFTCNKFLQYEPNFNNSLYEFLTTDIK